MIIKIISAITILSVLFATNASASGKLSLSAESAALLNAQTGELIYDKNASEKQSMASTTKIMTSLLAIESGKLANEITVTEDMIKVEGTSMGLLAGDSVSLDELVHGMLLQSGNDSANAAAVYLGGSVDAFVQSMNSRASEIGMLNTSFETPSGLDGKNHYSTAYDMALLGAHAVRNPKFLSVCSKRKATLTYGNPPYQRTLYNHNRLLEKYDYVYGIKTGFTKKSGRCLVSYAVNNGVELIAVTLNAPDDWTDHKKLFDYGFDSVKSVELKPELPEKVRIVGADKEFVAIESKKCCYSANSSQNIEYRIFLPKFVYSSVKKGQVVGWWSAYIDGKAVATVDIVIAENI